MTGLSVVFKLEIIYPFLLFNGIGIEPIAILAVLFAVINNFAEDQVRRSLPATMWKMKLVVWSAITMLVAILGPIVVAGFVVASDVKEAYYPVLPKLIGLFLIMIVIGRITGFAFDHFANRRMVNPPGYSKPPSSSSQMGK